LESSDIESGDVPDSIGRRLKKCVKLETTSLLELAVWRASCLWLDGSESFGTMQNILDQYAIERSFYPFQYKAERRYTSSTSVIMRGVVLFFGD